jgi:hypothetical protein
VEARISLAGGARSLILNVMRICDGETGPIVWLNATTNSELPEAWRPMQWRGLPITSPAPATVAPGLTRRVNRSP